MRFPIWRVTVVVGVVLAFMAAPIWSLLGPGVFRWHVQQPAAWQGGLEALTVFALLFALFRWTRGAPRWIGAAVTVALYARHHGVDFAILLSYAYLEGIFALGAVASASLGVFRGADPANPGAIGLVGLVAWSLLLWAASMAGFGSMESLGWMALLVLGAMIAMRRRPMLGGILAGAVRRTSDRNPAVAALIATLMLVMYAKASVSTDFDSNWYGLATDRALLASGSVFRSEGLVAPVHYYPKLTELLQVPMAVVGSIPAVVGLSIGCWLATLGTSSIILQELRVGRALRPYIIALVATLPAFANVSMTAKGDALAALLLSTAMVAVLRLKHGRSFAWFWVAMSAALLASQARLSNIPYTLALGLLALLAAARWIRKPPSPHRGQGSSPILFIATLALVILITSRTWLLAGVPLVAPNAALDLFSRWGMELKPPVGHLPTSDLLIYLPPAKALWAYLFDPRHYPLLQILWTGNAWLSLSLASLLLGWRRPVAWRRALPVLFVGLLFFPMLLGNRYIEASGADGNYFVTPVSCLMLFAGFLLQQALWKWQRASAVAATMHALAFTAAATSALICLVTGLWGPGTRAFDARLDRPVLDTALRRAAAWHDIGLERIAQRLLQEPPRTRVVGDVGGEGFWLPVRYEPIDIIALTRGELVETGERTLEFLRTTEVTFLIVRVPGESPPEGRAAILRQAVDALKQKGEAEVELVEGPYELWRLSSTEAGPASPRAPAR
ncbi:hypothetical protein [Pseudoxanthomonas sp. 10H]|uniref:hypothetical protein n=1 Tax=Pseudoxanthomonas sp. 10H TaxID=3242729 RepID=UPI00355856C1